MMNVKILAVLIGAVTVAAIASNADARGREYNPTMGRFLQRDPVGTAIEPPMARNVSDPRFTQRDSSSADQYSDGMNLYEYVGSNPAVLVDPTGLWILYRNGQSRAEAEAQQGDTPKLLAISVGLNTSQFKTWLALTGPTIKTTSGDLTLTQLQEDTTICPKERVTVPNTAYIDVGSYSYGILGCQLMLYKSKLQSRWSSEGLKVVYTGKWATSGATVLSHLKSPDIYKFAYIGHGLKGFLVISDDDVIDAGGYTLFGINEMELIACESNYRAESWKKNVSKRGGLVTVRGIMTWTNWDFVYENGE